ncbi:MAG: hypothetical protein sGL2_10380 [Candidatus Mesenet longicola]|nr:MAG: hypothetical protein sGL2_10380 [Candidatus Mesenet longicola]
MDTKKPKYTIKEVEIKILEKFSLNISNAKDEIYNAAARAS